MTVILDVERVETETWCSTEHVRLVESMDGKMRLQRAWRELSSGKLKWRSEPTVLVDCFEFECGSDIT